MKRRELFSAIATAAAAAGLSNGELTAQTVSLDVKELPAGAPALFVLETDQIISNEVAELLRAQLDEALKDTPLAGVKTIVLSEGMKLTLLDAHGRPLNRTITDA